MKKIYSLVAAACLGAFGMNVVAEEAATADGVYYVNGSFYTVTAQSEANPRVGAFDIEYGTYDGKYGQFHVNTADNPFNVKAQNEAKTYYVYLNDEEVANSETGTQAQIYDAQVSFADGDVIKIYDAQPFWTNMGIGFMQPASQVADKVTVTMDEVKAVEGIDDSTTLRVLKGTKFEIKAVEGAEINAVYYCNDDVEAVDGVYTVYADRQGDALIVIDMVETINAVSYVSGQFYTFSAASAANNRIEPLNVTYGEYDGEYGTMSFPSSANPFRLVGQNEAKSIHVYRNGTEIENAADPEIGVYEAMTNLADGDVLKVYGFEPTSSTVTFSFANGDAADYSDQVSVTMDRIVDVYNLVDPINVLQGTEFSVKPAEGYVISGVRVNGEAVEAQGGVYTFSAAATATTDVDIDMLQVSEGVAYIDGQFYVISLSSTKNNRVEPIDLTGDQTYEGMYRTIAFDAALNPFNLKLQNEAKSYYVYLNNEVVANSDNGAAAEMFMQDVILAQDDVLKIYGAQPFWTNMSIGFKGNRAVEAGLVDVTVDGVNPVANLADDAAAVYCLQGTKFEISAKAGNSISAVYVDNSAIDPVDGVYTVYASKEGEMSIEIEMMSALSAVAYIKGDFYNGVLASVANNRIEPLDVVYGEYAGEYRDMEFYGEDNPFRLVLQNGNNDFYVYQNGKKVENEAIAEGNPFEAIIELAEGDVLKAYSSEPFTSDVTFNFNEPAAEAASKVEVTVDRVNTVDDLADNATCNVLEGTEFQIKASRGNNIYSVSVNGAELMPTDGVYTFYADAEGSMTVEIAMQQTVEAVAYVKGSFYTATVSADRNNRVEPLDVAYGEYDGEYRYMAFNVADNPFNVKVQNESQTYFVYLNNEAVANSESGNLAQIFDAQIELAAGDVLKIYDAEPATASVAIDFAGDRAAEASQVEVTMDKIVAVEDLAENAPVSCLEGTQFEISAVEGYQIKAVYYGDEIVEAVDGVYTVTVTAGGESTITIEMNSGAKAMAFINGSFYTATVAEIDNPRNEVVDFTQSDYDNEYRAFTFDPEGNPFVVKAMNESQTCFVYLNDEEVANSETGKLANMFDAEIELAEGDVLKIYAEQPYWTNMGIGYMQPAAEVGDRVEVTMDGITAVEGIDDSTTLRVLQGTKFEIKAAEGAQIKAVYYCNDDVEAVDGVYTVYADRQGDALIVIDVVTDSGIASIVAGDSNNGNVYNLQGILVVRNADARQLRSLPAGIYIMNGKKISVR